MLQKQIIILALEPLETRYTSEWHRNFVGEMQSHLCDYEIIQLDGEMVSSKPTPGAFLDFTATNVWKSTQLAEFMKLVQSGKIRPGAYILVTDAWNPAILQIRYTSDLMNLDFKIGSIWHAGSYDPFDFLGRACGGKNWTQATEKALFHACDHNYFATHEHIKLFSKTYDDLIPDPSNPPSNVVRTGFPFEYFFYMFKPYQNQPKENLILFPHRLSIEKMPEVFRALAKRMPEYKWVICQEKELTKKEYHSLLSKSKIVFSANLQETLGIGAIEALMCDSFPMMPDRLTYPEMYDQTFLYPGSWANEHQVDLVQLEQNIKVVMNSWDNQDQMRKKIAEQREKIRSHYLTATNIYATIQNC